MPTVGSVSLTLMLSLLPFFQGSTLVPSGQKQDSFSRQNLVAWCIVPFDAKKRNPKERAALLKELGIKEFAYDWRPEHIPTFDQEVDELNKAGIHLRAFWFPSAINSEAKAILSLIERRKLDCELWVSLGDPSGKTQEEKVQQVVKQLDPILVEAKRLGVKVGLYNHGGWFGEPENMLQIVRKIGSPSVGIVYNLHHGHDHLPRLESVLTLLKDHLLCLNLNGMDIRGDRNGRKILPLGQGSEDLKCLALIRKSGYKGPLGILGHTNFDAKETLLDNLNGLEWLLDGGKGKPPLPLTPLPKATVQAPNNGTNQGLVALFPGKQEYRTPPLTMEWRGTLTKSDQYQVLIACDPKSSDYHWEIFQKPGSGTLAAYLPGMTPDHVETNFEPTGTNIHRVDFLFRDNLAEIRVDGKIVGSAVLKRKSNQADPGPLAIGGLPDRSFPALGNLAWCRIRKGIHRTDGHGVALPVRDFETLGFWKTEKGQLIDLLAASPSSAEPNDSKKDLQTVQAYLEASKTKGNPTRGAAIFSNAKLACVSCHKIGTNGGQVGPELDKLNQCLSPQQVVESLFWPQKEVKPEFRAWMVTTSSGKILQGYLVEETPLKIKLKEATTQTVVEILSADIEEKKLVGSLMPANLMDSLSDDQKIDLIAFLLTLGSDRFQKEWMRFHGHELKRMETKFPPGPIDPANWPNSGKFPNRERLYEFYQKQSAFLASLDNKPDLVSPFPGLDQGIHGHWGNQNEDSWRNGQWNNTDLGGLLSGVCRVGNITIAKAVAVYLGGTQQHTVVYNPETLQFEAAWKDGFVRFSDTRHGFMDGLIPKGPSVSAPSQWNWPPLSQYKGFYRFGNSVVFRVEVDGKIWLDSCKIVGEKIVRETAPLDEHSLALALKGGTLRMPEQLDSPITMGKGSPFAVDTFAIPFKNPWKSPIFPGDLDFLPNGDVLLCTMQGEIWRISGTDPNSVKATWRKVGTGIHQALGLRVLEGIPYVLGRDQITKLHDLNGDGEYDYHECFANCWTTSPGGHDYICGLEQDKDGSFVTASSNLGIMRISANGRSMEVLAKGFRNPDGIGLDSKGGITVPCSEGEWTPTSMICKIKKGGYYGYGGPKGGKAPDLPLVYLPRGLDNSSGGQTEIASKNWEGLNGLKLHFSYGACSQFLLLEDEVKGQPQGAFIQLPGDFESGVHRGRFNPIDGHLYVVGMQGWGTYASKDGNLQRVRRTTGPLLLPSQVRAHANGVWIRFTEPVAQTSEEIQKSAVALAWNYRYSPAYGSAEYSPSSPMTKGHDVLPIKAIHIMPGNKELFVEIPTIGRVNQLQIRVKPWQNNAKDVFLTVHNLADDFTNIKDYVKTNRPPMIHPIDQDLKMAGKTVNNAWKHPKPNARKIVIRAGANLSFSPSILTAKAGETLALEFENPDAVPHNWVLLPQGALAPFGDKVNRQISDPDAYLRHYIPEGSQVICYTDVVSPGEKFTVYFEVPKIPGRYPYVCSFPGHWMIMNGNLNVTK